jgi:hypothetical protein
MAKMKQGDLLSCSACGLVVTVDELCGCAETVLVCCDQPMVKGKAAANKAKKKMVAKPAKKTAPKKVASKSSAKRAAKPAVKKSVKAPKK